MFIEFDLVQKTLRSSGAKMHSSTDSSNSTLRSAGTGTLFVAAFPAPCLCGV